jgi:hypothetical protein
MKRYVAILFVLCVASAGLLIAQTKTSPAEDAVVKADKALGMAWTKGDKAAMEKMLDSDFSLIDTEGIMTERPDVLREGLQPLVPMTADTKVWAHMYGNNKVAWVTDNLGKKYAAHIWVERPQGWRLLNANEIETGTEAPGGTYRAPYDIPCDNPCKGFPYRAVTPNEKAAIAAWLDQEGANGPGRHDMHMGDNTIVISQTTTTPRNSATAPGPTPVQPRQPGTFSTGVAPAVWARTWDFGDAVVAIMLQPTYGGKFYWSSRIFGNHNGFWKMEESYHNTIATSPAMTVVPPKSMWPPQPARGRGANAGGESN